MEYRGSMLFLWRTLQMKNHEKRGSWREEVGLVVVLGGVAVGWGRCVWAGAKLLCWIESKDD